MRLKNTHINLTRGIFPTSIRMEKKNINYTHFFKDYYLTTISKVVTYSLSVIIFCIFTNCQKKPKVDCALFFLDVRNMSQGPTYIISGI